MQDRITDIEQALIRQSAQAEALQKVLANLQNTVELLAYRVFESEEHIKELTRQLSDDPSSP